MRSVSMARLPAVAGVLWLTLGTGWISATEATINGEAGADAEAVAGADAEVPVGEESAEGEGDAVVFTPEIEALLSGPSGSESYVEPEQCIRTRDIRSTDILDERHLVFQMRGKKYYLVQFRNRCFGLRPNVAISYQTRSSLLCRLDQITVFDPPMPTMGIPCAIPGFIPIEAEQIAQLREALKAQRRARRAPPPAGQGDTPDEAPAEESEKGESAG